MRHARFAIALVVWSALAIFFFQIATHSYRSKHVEDGPVPNPPLIDLEPSTLRILTLGNPQIYQDFLQIWMTQQLASATTENTNPDALQGARHGVHIESYFMAGCFTLAYRFKRPDLCFALMDLGLRANPESWRLPVIQGYIEYFLIKDPIRAAFFYSITASKPDAPEYIKGFVKKILNQEQITILELQENMSDVLNVEDNPNLQTFFRELSKP